MTDEHCGSIVYEAKSTDEEGGTLAVLLNGRPVGNIRKHPGGDSFVYFEGVSNEANWTLEGSNVAALQEKVEALLRG